MKTLTYFWQHHRLLLIGFLLAAFATTLFLVKLTVSVIYFANNRDVVIEPWMPIGYMAKSYEVDRDWLLAQTGLPADTTRPHQSIREAATAAGVSNEEMLARLLAAIEAERAK